MVQTSETACGGRSCGLLRRRFDRLERGQRETNDRLGKVEDAVGRVVEVLEAHSRHFERMEDALIGISDRMDRLTSAIVRGRTADLARLDAVERRFRSIETASRRRRKK
jgi:hypothetical protein